jgi:hypothetical protein
MALLMRYCGLLTLMMILVCGFPACPRAETSLRLQEQEIKAGLLYNFLKYIEWPAGSGTEASSTATVCIVGTDPFSGYLQPMAGRTVNQRTIKVRTVHDSGEMESCQLLFVSDGEKENWPQMKKSMDGKGVLTVGDFADFASSGGAIEFGLKDDHINVRLNMDAVAAARLHVEDRLLKLVTVVHYGGP